MKNTVRALGRTNRPASNRRPAGRFLRCSKAGRRLARVPRSHTLKAKLAWLVLAAVLDRASVSHRRAGELKSAAGRPARWSQASLASAEDRFASTHPLAASEPQPEPQRPEVADCPEDDRWLGTGRRAGGPRVVGYAHLREPASLETELDQQL